MAPTKRPKCKPVQAASIINHYNSITEPSAIAPSIASLRRFHNHVKRELLHCFTSPGTSLLDLCCGRGGDIGKWHAAKLKSVLAVDFAHNEIEEAKVRLAWHKSNQMDSKCAREFPRVDFSVVPDLSTHIWLGVGYDCHDVVSCMFALQYFCGSEQALRNFLTNVVIHLKQGGLFIGTTIDGTKVRSLLSQKEYNSRPLGLLTLRASNVSGSGSDRGQFHISLADTVISAPEHNKGEESDMLHEYFVDGDWLCEIAAEFNLQPVLPPYTKGLDSVLAHTEHTRYVLQHFDGESWYQNDFQDTSLISELSLISSLYCIFAFRLVKKHV